MRKWAAILAASASLTGCGIASVGNAVHGPTIWCAYHIWRLERDVRHHHLGWGAFQAVLAAHQCARVAHL